MMDKIRELIERRENGEKGFTLIELLVVIIIIGILAAIAIPLFMNQQKSAIDSATQSDVRNVATNIETLRVKNPTEDSWSITGVDALSDGSDTDGVATITADTSGDTAEVSLSDGTEILIENNGDDAASGFTVLGSNADGNQNGATAATSGDYENADTGSYVVYNSDKGGLQ